MVCKLRRTVAAVGSCCASDAAVTVSSTTRMVGIWHCDLHCFAQRPPPCGRFHGRCGDWQPSSGQNHRRPAAVRPCSGFSSPAAGPSLPAAAASMVHAVIALRCPRRTSMYGRNSNRRECSCSPRCRRSERRPLSTILQSPRQMTAISLRCRHNHTARSDRAPSATKREAGCRFRYRAARRSYQIVEEVAPIACRPEVAQRPRDHRTCAPDHFRVSVSITKPIVHRPDAAASSGSSVFAVHLRRKARRRPKASGGRAKGRRCRQSRRPNGRAPGGKARARGSRLSLLPTPPLPDATAAMMF